MSSLPYHGAALFHASRGKHVFPCGVQSKQPACARGCLEATTDAARINAWWSACPRYNVAIACGPQSNIWALDIDGGEAEHELAKLEAKHGKLPASVEVVTPGHGGRHIYFSYPRDGHVGNTVSKIAPGIDTRGQNGYVLAPPSQHPNGGFYHWSVDSAGAFAPAPPWLLSLIATNTPSGPSATPPEEWRALAATGADEGSRNQTIARLTGYLLRKGVDAFVTAELLQAWSAQSCRPPLPHDEVATIVDSIAAREMKRRRQ
jgi:hypothetical protein